MPHLPPVILPPLFKEKCLSRFPHPFRRLPGRRKLCSYRYLQPGPPLRLFYRPLPLHHPSPFHRPVAFFCGSASRVFSVPTISPETPSFKISAPGPETNSLLKFSPSVLQPSRSPYVSYFKRLAPQPLMVVEEFDPETEPSVSATLLAVTPGPVGVSRARFFFYDRPSTPSSPLSFLMIPATKP